jgi:Astacin (Peptidase family M12A)
MQYGKTAFSIDGTDTIIPLKDLKGETMGQRQRLSKSDIDRINKMYCDAPTRRPNPIPGLVQSINQWLSNMMKIIFGKFE